MACPTAGVRNNDRKVLAAMVSVEVIDEQMVHRSGGEAVADRMEFCGGGGGEAVEV